MNENQANREQEKKGFFFLSLIKMALSVSINRPIGLFLFPLYLPVLIKKFFLSIYICKKSFLCLV